MQRRRFDPSLGLLFLFIFYFTVMLPENYYIPEFLLEMSREKMRENLETTVVSRSRSTETTLSRDETLEKSCTCIRLAQKSLQSFSFLNFIYFKTKTK